MEYILQVQNLKKTFRTNQKEGLEALKGINFHLLPGESLGIVGESGSGKSTLARLLMHLTEATEGKILLNGADITHCSGSQLRQYYQQIQMVFQNPTGSFDPRKTLGDGIGESLKNIGMGKAERAKQVKELLCLCGLSEGFANRYPHEVSGGECQRAAIARALAISPKILICDEATSALDATVQKQIMELLTRLRDSQGLSCIFICHNLALAQSFCQRLLVMHEGSIVEEGPTDEVIFRPQADYTKRLLDAVLTQP